MVMVEKKKNKTKQTVTLETQEIDNEAKENF